MNDPEITKVTQNLFVEFDILTTSYGALHNLYYSNTPLVLHTIISIHPSDRSMDDYHEPRACAVEK